jgi:hypothetical protein
MKNKSVPFFLFCVPFFVLFCCHLAVIILVCHGEILSVPADTVKGYIRAPPGARSTGISFFGMPFLAIAKNPNERYIIKIQSDKGVKSCP